MDKMGQNFHKIEAVRLEGGDPPTVPQEGHNFVTSGFDFFHFFSLLEGIILMFWGEIGYGT